MITKEQAEYFIEHICSGLSCKRFISLFIIHENYIITKHKSHAEWINRIDGAETCISRYRIFKYKDYTNDKFSSTAYMFPLFEVIGRMNKDKYKILIDKIEELSKE